METRNANLIEYLQELVINNENYQRIIADGIISDEEMTEQVAEVEGKISDLEQTLSKSDFKKVAELLAELSVLHAILELKNK